MKIALNMANILPIILGIGGFFLARYIYSKKKRKEKLVCPLDSDCDAVVHSRYSTFLGIPLENLGMFYFVFIALFYISSLFIPFLNSTFFALFIPLISLLAFLFSIYLAMIQLLLIKQWCVWCLVSTTISAALFIIILVISPLNIKGLLAVIFKI